MRPGCTARALAGAAVLDPSDMYGGAVPAAARPRRVSARGISSSASSRGGVHSRAPASRRRLGWQWLERQRCLPRSGVCGGAAHGAAAAGDDSARRRRRRGLSSDVFVLCLALSTANVVSPDTMVRRILRPYAACLSTSKAATPGRVVGRIASTRQSPAPSRAHWRLIGKTPSLISSRTKCSPTKNPELDVSLR